MITRHFIRNKITSIPDNEIWYTSTDGNVVTPNNTSGFGANIISNTYENGSGVITFDGSVTSIGDNAFASRTSLTSIILPNSVTSIGGFAFERCFALTSISIPNSVTSIGSSAFCDCSSLTSVTIPEGVTRIEYSTFLYCGSLTSVTIPNSVTSILDNAFQGCSSLISVIIGNSVTSIGTSAFKLCTSLTTITCKATTPTKLRSLNNLSSVTAVYVPFESVEAYKTADGWSYYADKILSI